MKKIQISAIMAALLLLLAACGDSTYTQTVSADLTAYSQIMESEHIELDEAVELITGTDSDAKQVLELTDYLNDLQQCSGQFIQVGKSTGNVYTADVAFYLENGITYCTLDYTGYSGELGIGEVEKTQECGYLFESSPHGTFASRDQLFSIHFSPEQLHIEWADTCDELLTRDDGSRKKTNAVSFEQSEIYTRLKSIMDEAFSDYRHTMQYDDATASITFYLEAPAGARASLISPTREVRDVWDRMVESIRSMCEDMVSVIGYTDQADTVYFYLVDELNGSGVYNQDEYLLLIKDKAVVYNYLDTGSGSTWTDTSSAKTNSTTTATSGERNALQRAYDYLDYSAFSYSGLIDQLEFEGYTASEATYAADHCGADWNKQAAKKAQEYLDFSSFSRQELINQLEFEGFTSSQAEYGVNAVY